MSQWTKEEAAAHAAAGGKASGEARRAKAEMTPAKRAAEAVRKIQDASGELVEELLKAAKGQDEFKDLAAKDRLAAITKALDHGLGKPTARKQPESKPEGDRGSGISFGGVSGE